MRPRLWITAAIVVVLLATTGWWLWGRGTGYQRLYNRDEAGASTCGAVILLLQGEHPLDRDRLIDVIATLAPASKTKKIRLANRDLHQLRDACVDEGVDMPAWHKIDRT